MFSLVIIFSLNIISASNIGLIENSAWQSNLTAVDFSATAFGDVDNDGDLDLFLSGCLSAGASDCDNGAISKIYLNNGTTLTENSAWQSNLTGAGYGSMAFGDIDNDGDLDLALSGCPSGTETSCSNIFSKIYLNNGTSFVESSQWQNNLTGVYSGSTKLVDINNDGYLDLALVGKSSSSRIAKIYLNNGTSFVESSQWQDSLTGVAYSSIAFADVDGDSDLDLALTGVDSDSNGNAKIYLNNKTSLVYDSTWSSSLKTTTLGSIVFGDYDNDGDLDLIETGLGDYLYLYNNTGSTFIVHQKNSGEGGDLGGGRYEGSTAWGDYDNDGDLDFVATGYEQGRVSMFENDNMHFVVDNVAGAGVHDADLHKDALAWVDLDNDKDLDLISVGLQTAAGLLAKVYISNTSLTKNNSQSTPPNTFSSSYSEGVLNLTWNNGSDHETNSTGLYYNLMIGNSTDNHTIVSGVYGGSSGGGNAGGGASGYFGNMMQRKNITLDKYLSDDTYYWYVQTIDTGLQKSTWSDRQSIVVGADTDVPTISSVSSSVTSTTATITWTTNESANSTIYYGTTTATTSSSSSASLVISHSISLSGLSASTLYYYNVSSCDYWNNCNTSVQHSFTTSATPTTPPSNGGSPGGSSSSSTTTITPSQEEKLFDVDFSVEDSGSLEAKTGEIKTFSFNSQTIHKITMLEVTTSSAKIIIESEPIILILNISETKQIDINNDEIDDFEIKLISIISGEAKFSLTKLEGAEIVALEELDEAIRKQALFDVKVRISNLFKVVKSGRNVIAEIEVLNVNNIGQVDVLVDYYISDGKNNTITEGSDTLAVEAVASFVRSLSMPYDAKAGKYLFNVDVKYKGMIMASGSVEFRVIKSYEIIIGVGIFILIVLGIFFYLWRIKKKTEKIEKKEARLEKLVKKFKGGENGSHKNR